MFITKKTYNYDIAGLVEGIDELKAWSLANWKGTMKQLEIINDRAGEA